MRATSVLTSCLAILLRDWPLAPAQIDLISQVLQTPEDWSGPAPELLVTTARRLLGTERVVAALAWWDARIKSAAERRAVAEQRFRDLARKADAKWNGDTRHFVMWSLMEGGVRGGVGPWEGRGASTPCRKEY